MIEADDSAQAAAQLHFSNSIKKEIRLIENITAQARLTTHGNLMK